MRAVGEGRADFWLANTAKIGPNYDFTDREAVPLLPVGADVASKLAKERSASEPPARTAAPQRMDFGVAEPGTVVL
jgi:hypothetical protein